MGDSGSPRVLESHFALLIQIIKAGDSGSPRVPECLFLFNPHNQQMGDSGSPRVPECLFIIATYFSFRTPVPEFVFDLAWIFVAGRPRPTHPAVSVAPP